MKKANNVFGAILTLILIVGTFAAALYYMGKAFVQGIDFAMMRHEQYECGEWTDYAKVIRPWDPKTQTGYYLTKWQYDQCKDIGMPIENVHVVVSE